jgi:predicted HTH transcriptional regulator
MDEKSLIQILSQGENQKQAFLIDVSNRWNTAVLISSFANAQGGSLWIGVKPNGKIVGVYAEGIQKELTQLIESFFQNPFVLNTRIWKNKIHFVLEVIIENVKDESVFLVNERQQVVLFERHANKSVQASKIVLKNIQFKSQHKVLPKELSDQEREVLAIIKNNKQLSLSQLYKLETIIKSEIDLLVSQLVYRKLIEMDFSTDVTLYKFKSH